MAMKNSLTNIAGRAEALGMYPVQSEMRGVLYIYNDGEYAIVTPDFVWRMPAEKLKRILRELTGIVQDVEDLKDMEVRS